MKYIHRFFSFVATRLAMFTVIAALLILAFYLAMNTANIYLLLNDGMTARTSVILTREDADELKNFFTNDFLLSDETLNIGLSSASPYIDYTITDFQYRLSLEWVWAWPWENSATATIVERVPKIVGEVVSGKKRLVTSGALSATPPSWYGGRYTVRLVRQEGRWKIDQLVQTQLIIEEEQPTARPSTAPARP